MLFLVGVLPQGVSLLAARVCGTGYTEPRPHIMGDQANDSEINCGSGAA